MKWKLGIICTILTVQLTHGSAQVFNQGINQLEYKQLLERGITYIRTGNQLFDSCLIAGLETCWNITDVNIIERLERPEKNTTVLFVTTKKPSREFFEDRRNQKVLVLYPASLYKFKGEVNMERTLGYMYFNGFYELLDEEHEYLFAKMMIGSLNAGLKWISEHQLTDIGRQLNQSISESIIKESGTPLGNTLIIHREQTRNFVDISKIEKAGIRYRLVGQDEYYNLIRAGNKMHYVLYFSFNTFTELSIINIATGQIVYTKHFYEDYPELKPKELKEIAVYFG